MGRSRKRLPFVRKGTKAPASVDHRAVRGEQLRFALRFVVLAGVLGLLYCAPYERTGSIASWFHTYLSAYAKMVATVVSIFDHTARVSGQTIVGRYSVEIVRECDAMQANIIYVAAILATSASWVWRATGVFAGVAVIAIVNVARISALYFIGVYWPLWFDLAHEWAQVFMIGAPVGVFLYWARTAAARIKAAHQVPVHAAS